MAVDGVKNNKSEALDLYNSAKVICFGGVVNEEIAVRVLTKASENILGEFETTIEDQNEYIVELENTTQEAQNKIKNAEDEIKRIQQEISKMLKKSPYSEMSQEDKEKYNSLVSQLATLEGNRETTISDYSAKISEEEEESSFVSREKVLDYGKTLIDKATPLANTKIKNDWWHKLWGATGKSEKEAGESGIDVGNQMLDAVVESDSLSKEIKKKKSSGI